MTNNTNKSFWQRFAKIYTVFMTKNNAAYTEISDKIRTYVDDEKEVLELGCGTGQITFLMAEQAKMWIATDYSENMIQEAQKRCEHEMPECKAIFEVADATCLTYEAETFDVVVVANVLHIMPDPDAALKEISRVLKKGGIMFAPTFVYEKGYSKLLIWLMERAGFKTYYKWSRMEYVKYVSQIGLKVIGDTLIKAHPLSECVLVSRKE